MRVKFSFHSYNLKPSLSGIDEINVPLTLIRDLNSPSDDEEDENDNEVTIPQVSYASKENASPSAPSSPMSPKSPQPQLVTGDLGRMCAIM